MLVLKEEHWDCIDEMETAGRRCIPVYLELYGLNNIDIFDDSISPSPLLTDIS